MFLYSILRKLKKYFFFTVNLLLVLAVSPLAAPKSSKDEEFYSPYVHDSYPQNVYWGDTHVHTNNSVDSNFSVGGKYTALTPLDAYRFAQGRTVRARNGMNAKLYRPLDFIVIADHAENMGIFPSLDDPGSPLFNTAIGKRLRDEYQAGVATNTSEKAAAFLSKLGQLGNITDKKYRASVWENVTALADQFNDPGIFTAFIGYEWTSWGDAISTGNLHRNVIFKDGADKANQILPFSAVDSSDPEDLWHFFADYQHITGGEVLSIPHSPNLSTGNMFKLNKLNGDPLDTDYAETRSRWEPLLEMTQTKGDSETHAKLSPQDNFADYETWNSWFGVSLGYEGVDIYLKKTKGKKEKTWSKEEIAKKNSSMLDRR